MAKTRKSWAAKMRASSKAARNNVVVIQFTVAPNGNVLAMGPNSQKRALAMLKGGVSK